MNSGYDETSLVIEKHTNLSKNDVLHMRKRSAKIAVFLNIVQYFYMGPS